MWPVLKSVALENVLITLFFCDFLLGSYLGIILQDTRQGFTVILESWDFRIERSVSSHIPPRICRQLCSLEWRTARDTEHLLRSITIELRVHQCPLGFYSYISYCLKKKTKTTCLSWETEFSNLNGHFYFFLYFIFIFKDKFAELFTFSFSLLQISRFYSIVWRQEWNPVDRLKESLFQGINRSCFCYIWFIYCELT